MRDVRIGQGGALSIYACLPGRWRESHAGQGVPPGLRTGEGSRTVRISRPARRRTRRTARPPTSWPPARSRAGAWRARASSCSRTPATCCPTAGSSHLTGPGSTSPRRFLRYPLRAGGLIPVAPGRTRCGCRDRCILSSRCRPKMSRQTAIPAGMGSTGASCPQSRCRNGFSFTGHGQHFTAGSRRSATPCNAGVRARIRGCRLRLIPRVSGRPEVLQLPAGHRGRKGERKPTRRSGRPGGAV